MAEFSLISLISLEKAAWTVILWPFPGACGDRDNPSGGLFGLGVLLE
jgi:hypothetical protein